ncbi:MAG: hypothetical protein GY793_07460 [Proteobacteria bacterium]|nr:hypothetical protein [Pseudomonadota bacterium]
MFSALASVDSKYPPRGFPINCCEEIFYQYHVKIIPDDAADDDKNDIYEWIYQSEADRYFKTTNKDPVEFEGTLNVNAGFENPSYLNYKEVIESLEHQNYLLGESPQEFQMLIEFMEIVDKRFGEGSSRIVFWFDE